MSIFNKKFVSKDKLSKMQSSHHTAARLSSFLQYLQYVDDLSVKGISKFAGLSEAQLFQDLFVIEKTNFKKNGFFVEFGATNGKSLSNTYVLEKSFEWDGILAEPARVWHNDLRKTRNCKIDTRCVWSASGATIDFREIPKHPQISTIEKFKNADSHSNKREKANLYSVESISLNDLLNFHSAPRNIDYISIDTEGSEYDILENFNFDTYEVQIFTIEHSYTKEKREKIFQLLSNRGYERVNVDWSDFDDWYVLKK